MVETSSEKLARHVSHALDLLLRDSPVHFSATRERARGLAVTVKLDGEPPFSVRLSAPPWVTPSDRGDVELELASTALHALLRGDATLDDVILDETVQLRGALAHLDQLFDALGAWLHGALRCPSLARLHGAFLADLGTSHLTANREERRA